MAKPHPRKWQEWPRLRPGGGSPEWPQMSTMDLSSPSSAPCLQSVDVKSYSSVLLGEPIKTGNRCERETVSTGHSFVWNSLLSYTQVSKTSCVDFNQQSSEPGICPGFASWVCARRPEEDWGWSVWLLGHSQTSRVLITFAFILSECCLGGT